MALALDVFTPLLFDAPVVLLLPLLLLLLQGRDLVAVLLGDPQVYVVNIFRGFVERCLVVAPGLESSVEGFGLNLKLPVLALLVADSARLGVRVNGGNGLGVVLLAEPRQRLAVFLQRVKFPLVLRVAGLLNRLVPLVQSLLLLGGDLLRAARAGLVERGLLVEIRLDLVVPLFRLFDYFPQIPWYSIRNAVPAPYLLRVGNRRLKARPVLHPAGLIHVHRVSRLHAHQVGEHTAPRVGVTPGGDRHE